MEAKAAHIAEEGLERFVSEKRLVGRKVSAGMVGMMVSE